jgi:hypothetical protein
MPPKRSIDPDSARAQLDRLAALAKELRNPIPDLETDLQQVAREILHPGAARERNQTKVAKRKEYVKIPLQGEDPTEFDKQWKDLYHRAAQATKSHLHEERLVVAKRKLAEIMSSTADMT